MNTITPFQKALHLCRGIYGMAEICGVSRGSVYQWRKIGRLPRTEWTGETQYAEKIEIATHGMITKTELLSYVPRRKKI